MIPRVPWYAGAMLTNQSDIQPPNPEQRWSTPVKLIDYTDYADAQRAVDSLSDQGFPVATVSIVWSGLRKVEHVTGRRTVVRAAIEGAIAGAWFGTLIGLILALLVDVAGSEVGIVFTYFVVGAAGGALWYGVNHALRRGSRDFSIVPMIQAERYELWVAPETVELAADLLDIGSHRPGDPDVERAE